MALRIGMILGSTRPGRRGDQIAAWTLATARAHGGADGVGVAVGEPGQVRAVQRGRGKVPPAELEPHAVDDADRVGGVSYQGAAAKAWAATAMSSSRCRIRIAAGTH